MTARIETDQEWQEQKMDESQKHGRNEEQQRVFLVETKIQKQES